jgi:hypothetical protein
MAQRVNLQTLANKRLTKMLGPRKCKRPWGVHVAFIADGNLQVYLVDGIPSIAVKEFYPAPSNRVPNRFRHKSPNSSIPGAQCLTNSIFQNIKNNARPFRSFCRRRQRGAYRPHLSKWTVEVNIFANVRAEETVRFLSTVSADGAIVLGTKLAVDEVCAFRKAPMPVVILDTYYGHLRPAGRAHRRRTRPSGREGPDRRRTHRTRQRASEMRYTKRFFVRGCLVFGSPGPRNIRRSEGQG